MDDEFFDLVNKLGVVVHMTTEVEHMDVSMFGDLTKRTMTRVVWNVEWSCRNGSGGSAQTQSKEKAMAAVIAAALVD